jgi:hypothetical protein
VYRTAEVFSMSSPTVDRQRVLEKAALATPAEKAASLLLGLPEHPLNKLARELAHYLWTEDRSNPKPPAATLATEFVRHWLSDEPWNRHDLRGSRATVDEAVANALKLVAERDAAQPDWFTRRTEHLLNAPPRPPQIESVPSVKVPEPEATTPEPEPMKMDPIARVAADLAARAELLIKTDSWLGSLSLHSPEIHTRIIAALSSELLQRGFVSGDFAAKLYNDLRPRAVSAYPERRF